MQPPQLSFREFVYGMFVMSVLNGFLVIILAIAIPIALTLAGWAYEGKIFEPNVAIALGVIATAFLELNIIQIARWCLRYLFDTPLRRITTIALLALWHLIMRQVDGVGVFDWVLLAGAAFIAANSLVKKGT